MIDIDMIDIDTDLIAASVALRGRMIGHAHELQAAQSAGYRRHCGVAAGEVYVVIRRTGAFSLDVMGETEIPAGAVVVALTDDVTGMDGFIAAWQGSTFAVPARYADVSNVYPLMSHEITGDAATDPDHGRIMQALVDCHETRATERRDQRHDVALLLQAFTAGTFRNGWQDQWDATGEEYIQGHATAIAEAFAPLGIYWPTDHVDASRMVMLFRILQSDDVDAWHERAMMEVALSGWAVPGTSIDYTHSGAGMSGWSWLASRRDNTTDSLRLMLEVAQSELADMRKRFRLAWADAWDVLDDAARTHEWCGEYESTAGVIAEGTRTEGLTYDSREREWSFVVTGTVDVVARETITRTITVTANSLDDAMRDVRHGYATDDLADAMEDEFPDAWRIDLVRIDDVEHV